jgi:S1-C subfamily serine protease
MNLFDLIVVLLAVAAGLGGWRFGFVTRVLAWCGVALGLLVGIHFVPRVVTSFGGTNADDRVTVAILFLLLVITLGQTAGFGVSLLVHRPARVRALPAWDRTLGATLGVTGTLLLVWLLMPSMSAAQGWPARVARGSALVHLADHAPDPPDRFEAIGYSIRDAPYPVVAGGVDVPGPPPLDGRSIPTKPIRAQVRQSIVRVSSEGCGYVHSGSGWTYAPELVVTAAHVIARSARTTVDSDEQSLHASVVSFDSKRDIAILRVPDLRAPPLSDLPSTDGRAALFGHPGGHELRVVDERFVAVSDVAVSDVLDPKQSYPRDLLRVRGEVAQGDSGGPLVDVDGRVVGLVFSADHSPTSKLGWATAIGEAEDAMRSALGSHGAVGTGPCLYSADAPERGHKRSNTG